MTLLSTTSYPTITLPQVDELITAVRNEIESSSGFEVYRVRNNDLIETFSSSVDALRFIDDQDYDTSRVLVRVKQTDQETADTLTYLRDFRREAVNDCPSFISGGALIRADVIDADFTKQRVARDYPGTDFTSYPFNRIDWDGVADDLKSRAYLRSSYATLITPRYYDLESLV